MVLSQKLETSDGPHTWALRVLMLTSDSVRPIIPQ